jgi:hypothetical protein
MQFINGHAAELTPQDLAENVVVKVADEVEVDISRTVGKASYAEAQTDIQRVQLDGIEVPYVGCARSSRQRKPPKTTTSK